MAKGKRRIAKRFLVLILQAVVVGGASEAWAKRTFMPKIVDYAGKIELDSALSRKKSESNTSSSIDEKTDFRERLTITAYGYMYHPLFNIFQLTGSAGLGQLRDRNEDGVERENDAIETFHLSTTFLPEHPYNLQITYDRDAPMLTSGYSDSLKREIDRMSTVFRYRKKPWTGRLTYSFIDSRGGASTFKSDSYDAYLSYSQKNHTTSGGYRHDEDQNSQRGKRIRDKIYVDNALRFRRAEFDTELEFNREDMDDLLEKAYRVGEEVRLTLPWNFESTLDGSYIGRETDATGGGFGFAGSSKSDLLDGQFILDHRLFESVVSRFKSRYVDADSTGSASTMWDNEIESVYTKIIPWQGTLGLRVMAGRTDTDRNVSRTGSLIGFTERMSAAASNESSVLKATLRLTGKFADKDSITIRVVGNTRQHSITTADIVSTSGKKRLTFPLAGPEDLIIEVTLADLNGSASGTDFDNGKEYDFIISYRVMPGSYETVAKELEWTANVKLFHELLNLYYEKRTTSQRVTSGIFPLGPIPEKAKKDGVGLFVLYAPFSTGGKFSHTRSDSDINQFRERRWQVFGEYSDRHEVSPYSSLHTGLALTYTKVLDGVVADRSVEDKYQQEVDSLVEFQSIFPRFDLDTTVYTGYEYERGHQIIENLARINRVIVGRIDLEGDEIETEGTWRAGFRAITIIPGTAMRFNLNGEYRARRGNTDADIHRIGSKIRWTVGRLDFDLGLNYSLIDSIDEDGDWRKTEDVRMLLEVDRYIF